MICANVKLIDGCLSLMHETKQKTNKKKQKTPKITTAIDRWL